MTQALVIGCGSIGSRHIRNLRHQSIDVIACDIDANKLKSVAAQYDVSTTTDYEAGLDNEPDCVFVCTPPTAHIENALSALEVGADVFIEKPIAARSEAAKPLISKANESDAIVYVACNMRFHPPVQTIDDWIEAGEIGDPSFIRLRYGNALPNWRPGDYRDYYSASDEKGGGIILDAIHEIDLADHWIGETDSVLGIAGKLSDLDIDVDDTAEVLLYQNDRIAEVHMDCIRPVRARTYELIGDEGMVRWHAERKNPEISTLQLHDAEGQLCRKKEYELTGNEMYVNELQNFLDCRDGVATPPIDVERGTRLVELTERVDNSEETV